MPIKSFLIISKFKDLNIGFELLYAKSKFSYDIILNFVISSMTGFLRQSLIMKQFLKWCCKVLYNL